MINKFKNIDLILFLLTIILAIIGIVFCFSTVHTKINGFEIVKKQSISILIGVFLIFIFSSINYQVYKQYAVAIYISGLILLISVLLFGKSHKGQRGWFEIGYFALQPAEIVKIFFILSLAGIVDSTKKQIQHLGTIIFPILLGSIYSFIIVIQPDFGGAIVYIPLTLIVLVLSGADLVQILVFVIWGMIVFGLPIYTTFISINNKIIGNIKFPEPWLLIIILIILILIAYVYLNRLGVFIPGEWLIFINIIIITGTFSGYFIQKFLKEYQKQRLIMFINPALDSKGAGYNIIQSKIAVGSGGIFGKGYMSGTQGKLGFLPERHTDFIFSAISEEMGFFFVAFIFLLYMFFLYRIFYIAKNARDNYGSLVASGIFFIFSFFIIFNIGMSIGLLPITGVTLPFISYGGSSLITYMIAVGILMNIFSKRFKSD